MTIEGFPIELFLNHVRREDVHWMWTGALGGKGNYGIYTWVKDGQRITKVAHVWSYLYFVGPIPEDYEVDHSCRIHACVNPFRCLEAVTQEENNRRKRRKFCKNDHELTEENLYYHPNGTVHGCKKCRRAAFLRWKEKG